MKESDLTIESLLTKVSEQPASGKNEDVLHDEDFDDMTKVVSRPIA